ncbi:MAG: CHASE2 domain-containing protein, partial [Sphingobacteriales bacterium]
LTARKNIVLAYNLQVEKKQAKPEGFLYPSLSAKGYANFVGEEGGTIRYFAPVFKAGNASFLSFTSAIMQIANPTKQQAFEKKYTNTAQINYSRTEDKYITISGKSLLNGETDSNILTGKIVLMGYVSGDANSIEDKHFTPLNSKSVGKSVPDMSGVYIHANILSMMNSQNYVSKWPTWLVWTLAVILCWLHMSLFIRYFLDKHIWFHLVAKMAQLISAILIVYLGLLFYYKWDIKINLTPSFVAIILAVDVLYFYEALVAWLHKKFGFHSLFVHHGH